MIAVGVPGWPRTATSWSWWPLATVPAALLIARFAFGRLRAPVVAVSAVLGTAWAFAISAWGVPGAGAATLLMILGLVFLTRRRQPR